MSSTRCGKSKRWMKCKLEDIRIAQKWEISGLSENPGFANIQSLSETLKRQYVEV